MKTGSVCVAEFTKHGVSQFKLKLQLKLKVSCYSYHIAICRMFGPADFALYELRLKQRRLRAAAAI